MYMEGTFTLMYENSFGTDPIFYFECHTGVIPVIILLLAATLSRLKPPKLPPATESLRPEHLSRTPIGCTPELPCSWLAVTACHSLWGAQSCSCCISSVTVNREAQFTSWNKKMMCIRTGPRGCGFVGIVSNEADRCLSFSPAWETQ